MRIRLHLKLEVFNQPEAERAMPAYLLYREILVRIGGTFQKIFCSSNYHRSEICTTELEKKRDEWNNGYKKKRKSLPAFAKRMEDI